MLIEEILLKKPQQQLKESVKRSLGYCIYCGECSDQPLTVDHIRPRSRGGSTNHWNLAPACVPCNRDKANSDVWVWWRASRHWERALSSGRVDLLIAILDDRRSLAEYLIERHSPQFRIDRKSA